MFAVRASRPVSVAYPLAEAPHSLRRQSTCDLSGRCHDSGWGVGYYRDGEPHRVRSTHPAGADPRFVEAAGSVESPTVLGHVRLASMGSIAERNCHPFASGRWMFAHNGTLTGFDTDPDRLRRLIPADRLAALEGETDSEHIFALLLGRLKGVTGSADAAARVIRDAVVELAALYPGTAEEPTKLNFVLTDGEVLVASRWKHALHRFEQRGPGPVATGGGPIHAVAVASEPITGEGWVEVPDGSVVTVRDDLTTATTPITS
jgi:glutamine amidotransferase